MLGKWVTRETFQVKSNVYAILKCMAPIKIIDDRAKIQVIGLTSTLVTLLEFQKGYYQRHYTSSIGRTE